MEEKITFLYRGKNYTMTQDEIEAAYRYQEHRYNLEDAERQLEYYVFGYEIDDPDNLTEAEEEEADEFFHRYGLTFSEARKFADSFATVFECNADCSVDDNSRWENAIRSVLKLLSTHKATN